MPNSINLYALVIVHHHTTRKKDTKLKEKNLRMRSEKSVLLAQQAAIFVIINNFKFIDSII